MAEGIHSMTGMTTLTAQNLLQYVTAKAAMPALATPGSVWLGLFTVVGTDAGTGFTELSGSGYARALVQAASINAASSAIPSVISNSANLSLGPATVAWSGIVAWGLFDAVTSGNLLYWDFLGASPWFPCTITSASPGVVTAIGITAGSTPTLINGASVVFTAEYGGALPAILTQYTAYTVAGLASDTFNVAQNTAATSACNVRQITSATIGIGLSAVFTGGAPGTLVLTAA
jgi:hypothetical protein